MEHAVDHDDEDIDTPVTEQRRPSDLVSVPTTMQACRDWMELLVNRVGTESPTWAYFRHSGIGDAPWSTVTEHRSEEGTLTMTACGRVVHFSPSATEIRDRLEPVLRKDKWVDVLITNGARLQAQGVQVSSHPALTADLQDMHCGDRVGLVLQQAGFTLGFVILKDTCLAGTFHWSGIPSPRQRRLPVVATVVQLLSQEPPHRVGGNAVGALNYYMWSNTDMHLVLTGRELDEYLTAPR